MLRTVTAQEEDRSSDDDFEDSGDEDGLHGNDDDDDDDDDETHREDEVEGAKATMLDLRDLVNKPRSSTPDNNKTKKKYEWMKDGDGDVDFDAFNSDGIEDDRPRKRRAR